jgi:mannose-6-phosphate isomerase-like protein (cupin superfamily)/uncharacterized glyoxalase superfamily protein PhnB
MSRPPAGLRRTIPALPVADVTEATAHYRDRFGFAVLHADQGFAVLGRDDSVLHLWQADDARWRQRGDRADRPVRSGAESFLAGTASCRIEVLDVDGLYAELDETGVLHPISRAGPQDTDFGTREFATLDRDGNLLEFFRWRAEDRTRALPAKVWLPGPLKVEVRVGAGETGGTCCVAVDHPPPRWALPPHHHAAESETVHVLEGRFEMHVAGARSELGPGDSIHIPRGVEHSGGTVGDGPGRRLLVFAPAGMETFFLAAGAGRPEEIKEPSELARIAAEHGWRFS